MRSPSQRQSIGGCVAARTRRREDRREDRKEDTVMGTAMERMPVNSVELEFANAGSGAEEDLIYGLCGAEIGSAIIEALVHRSPPCTVAEQE